MRGMEERSRNVEAFVVEIIVTGKASMKGLDYDEFTSFTKELISLIEHKGCEYMFVPEMIEILVLHLHLFPFFSFVLV